jgi:acyl-CoA reductase-like NAD-dependent aldehyde dehydrogenase
VGHGARPSTSIGSLITPRAIEKLKVHVADAEQKGERGSHWAVSS